MPGPLSFLSFLLSQNLIWFNYWLNDFDSTRFSIFLKFFLYIIFHNFVRFLILLTNDVKNQGYIFQRKAFGLNDLDTFFSPFSNELMDFTCICYCCCVDYSDVFLMCDDKKQLFSIKA